MAKYLFLDTNALVEDVDTVALKREVVPALGRLVGSGYRLVFLRDVAFPTVQDFVLRLLRSQGMSLLEEEPLDGAIPLARLAARYAGEGALEKSASRVVGASAVAEALEIARIEASDVDWRRLAKELVEAPRVGRVERRTKETTITVEVVLDGEGEISVATGLGYYDHLLEQIAKHGGFGLKLKAEGDLHVDEHHTIEDVALALGEALKRALGDKRGIGRYGFTLPMDEAQARVAVDLSGRPFAVFKGEIKRERIGAMPTELVPHFFRSLADSLGAAVHVEVDGENAHHMVEASFKGLGRALRPALRREESGAVPSTKGAL